MQGTAVVLLAAGIIALCGGALLHNQEKRNEEREIRGRNSRATHNIMYAHRTKRK